MLLTIGYYLHGGWRKGRIVTEPAAHDAGEPAKADCEPASRSMPVG